MSGDFESAFAAAEAEVGQAPSGEQPSAAALSPELETEGAPTPAEFEFHKDWNKETRETLQGLLQQPEGRKYLEAFHKQYGSLDERFRGIQSNHDKYQAQLNQFGQVIAPFQQYFQMRGAPPQQEIGRALAWAQHLYQNPQQGLAQLARELGVDVGGGAQQQQDNDVYVDPYVKRLEETFQSRLDQLEQSYQQVAGTFQGQQQNQILGQIHAFRQAVDEQGNPKAAYFDDLLPEITRQVTAGYSLEDAYRIAAYANSDVWSKIQADQAKAAEAAAKKAAQASLAEAQKAERATGARSPSGNGQGSGPPKPRNKDEAFNLAWEKGKAAATR